MKKVTLPLLIASLMLILSFTGVAHAAGSIEDIHNATTIQQLELAMHETSELTDEMTKFDALTYSEQYDILTDLMVRKNQKADMAAFKEFFAMVYEDATTYMHFVEGYPYVTSESRNGAYVVVKTDISGWIYVISLRDEIVGGIGEAYDFMKYYHTDNGENKTKVWVQGGVETKIPVPAQFGSGWTYRAYLCLKGNGNVNKDVTMVKYTAERFYYSFDLIPLDEHILGTLYDLYLTASMPCTYTGIFYIDMGGPVPMPFLPTEDTYDTIWESQWVDSAFSMFFQDGNYIEATLHFEDGSVYTEIIPVEYMPIH